jgi:hypothetical protein
LGKLIGDIATGQVVDPKHISTSCAERQNLSMRTGNRLVGWKPPSPNFD